MKRFAAVLLLIVFLFSFSFPIASADHDCIGDDCPVCSVIALAVSIVSLLAIAGLSHAVIYRDEEGRRNVRRENLLADFPSPVSLFDKLTS